jgi:hypothetical protein
MRRSFHIATAAFLVAILIAPIGMFRASSCAAKSHGCCGEKPLVASDCCKGQAGSLAIAPEMQRSLQVSVAHTERFERTADLQAISFDYFEVSTSLPIQQAPPLVLRT